EPVLLALLLPGVAGEEAGPLQRDALLRVELGQRPGDAEAEGAGLARHAAAADRGVDVVHLGGARQPQRLGGEQPVRGRREVRLERPLVDGDGAATRAYPDAGDGLLAAAGGLHEGLGHGDLSSTTGAGRREPGPAAWASGQRADGSGRRTPSACGA